MAYNFGQFLSTNYDSYLVEIPNGSGGYQISDLIITENEKLYTNKKITYSMSSSNCYYLKFRIKNKKNTYKQDEPGIIDIPGKQDIRIGLAHSNPSDTDKQSIKTITIAAAKDTEEETYISFDLIIAPNDNYDEIQFILNRVASFDERTIDLQVDKYAVINNVISQLNLPGEASGKLKQIGVQGEKGLQMCIDGESIKIGRTGIYEINHGYTISFLGFIYSQNNNKPFILDYQY